MFFKCYRFNSGMNYNGNHMGNKYQGPPRHINNSYNQRGGFQNRHQQGGNDMAMDKNGFQNEGPMVGVHVGNGVSVSTTGQSFNSYNNNRNNSGYNNRGNYNRNGGSGYNSYNASNSHNSYYEDWSKALDKDERLEK